MDCRDQLNKKIFDSEIKNVLKEARAGEDERVDNFLKVLHKAITVDAPDSLRGGKVNLIGSALLKTTLHDDLAVDIVITIPNKRVNLELIRRHGWIEERETYLSELCAFLRSEDLVATVERSTSNFNRSLVKVCGPTTSGGKGWSVRLHVGLPLQPPITNYMRQKIAVERSPFYSQLVLEDSLTISLYTSFHNMFSELPALTDAAILLKLWAVKQNLLYEDGLSENTINGILYYLAKVESIAEGMTAASCFRLALQFLAGLPSFSDLSQGGTSSPTLGAQLTTSTQQLISEHKESYPVILFFDGHNIWYNSSFESKIEIRQQAQTAINLLNTSMATDAIEQLFLIPKPFFLKYDMYMTIPLPTKPAAKAANETTHDEKYVLNKTFLADVHDILYGAISNRIGRSRSRIDYDTSSVTIGFGLAKADSLDKHFVAGPPLEDTAAAEDFTKIWGSRSYIARTDDGVVRRCAKFTEASNNEEFLCLMVKTLLRAYNLQDGIRVVGGKAVEWILMKTEEGGLIDPMKSVHYQIQSSVDELTTWLKDLDNFPLDVMRVDGVHVATRNTDVAPPMPHSIALRTSDPHYSHDIISYSDKIEPMELIVSFSQTSAWPEHREAIENIKTAIYCKMGQRLRKERRLVCIPRSDSLDVLLNGFVFRIYLYHPREIQLLRNMGFSAAAELYERKLHTLPQHCATVCAYSAGFAAFSPSVRMLKKWISIHMMGSYINEETAELIMCSCFGGSYPPRTPLTGFARAMHLIASWDWSDLPLVIPSITGDVIGISRKRRPGSAMWINTEYSDKSPFTQDTPNQPMLKRFKGLAQQTLLRYFDCMQSITDETSQSWAPLFTTSLKPFDLLVTLNKEVVLNLSHNYQSKKATGDAADINKYPRGFLFRPGCDTRRQELHKLVCSHF